MDFKNYSTGSYLLDGGLSYNTLIDPLSHLVLSFRLLRSDFWDVRLDLSLANLSAYN